MRESGYVASCTPRHDGQFMVVVQTPSRRLAATAARAHQENDPVTVEGPEPYRVVDPR